MEILNKLGGKRLDEVVVLSVFCDIVRYVAAVATAGAVVVVVVVARQGMDRTRQSDFVLKI